MTWEREGDEGRIVRWLTWLIVFMNGSQATTDESCQEDHREPQVPRL
jgi:hypothetical protein